MGWNIRELKGSRFADICNQTSMLFGLHYDFIALQEAYHVTESRACFGEIWDWKCLCHRGERNCWKTLLFIDCQFQVFKKVLWAMVLVMVAWQLW